MVIIVGQAESLKILIAGGLFSLTAKYDNAVFAIANALSQLADVCVLSVSRFPRSRLRPPHTRFNVVEPCASWRLLMECIRNFGHARRTVSRYVSLYSPSGVLSFVRYLANYSQLGLTIESYGPDVVHVHSNDLERAGFIDFLLSSNRHPFLLTVHGLSSLDPNIPTPYDERPLEKRILKELSKRGVFITFVSSGLKEATLQHFGIADRRLTVVPNGVDMDRFRPVSPSRKNEIRTKYGVPLQRKILIQVGELWGPKNHMLVLRSLASLNSGLLRQLLYIVVGGGIEKSSLIRFCRENQLAGSCVFMGRRYGMELVELYQASDLLLIPSTSESFPLVMLEGMASGLPVLTFADLWPVADIANHQNSVLVQERTVESFNEALVEATQRSWNSSEIRRFAERFTWLAVAARYKALYSKIVEQHSGGNSTIKGALEGMSGERSYPGGDRG